MTRAPDTWIIATRTWPHPIGGTDRIPPWRPTFIAAMTVDAAAARRRLGDITTAIGRVIERSGDSEIVVEQLFAIPLKRGGGGR